MKERERELKKLRRVNEILKLASAIFAQAEIDRRLVVALTRDPRKRYQRAQRDGALVPEIECVWKANMQVQGADKVWCQLARKAPPLLAAPSKGSCGAPDTRRDARQACAHDDLR